MTNSGDLRPGLKPPQFSLRSLLLAVTLLAVVFALFNVLPPMVMAGLIFLLISILAHMAGNAIGTRLRDSSSRSTTDETQGRGHLAAASLRVAPALAAQTQLSQRRSLGWPVLAATGTGLLAGGGGGGAWTFYSSGPQLAAINIVVGAVAFAVLGGLAAFLIFSFAQVGVGALRQALASRPQADDTSG
ncbi:MAG TPA: hypothetical protein VFB96_21495 [Pirellulaceae bacterium]|nr:hypothetical protein [Pirellulaceae bacterium]